MKILSKLIAMACLIPSFTFGQEVPTYRMDFLFEIDKNIVELSRMSMENIFEYMNTIVYDEELRLKTISGNRKWDDIDIRKTVKTKSGICIDKAVLMGTLMKLKGVNCEVVVFPTKDSEHAILKFEHQNMYYYYDPTIGDYVGEPINILYKIVVPDFAIGVKYDRRIKNVSVL